MNKEKVIEIIFTIIALAVSSAFIVLEIMALIKYIWS